MGKQIDFRGQHCQKYRLYEKKIEAKDVENSISYKKLSKCTWVVLQKLPKLSDTHFSQVLNKLEKIFFHGFIKYHLALPFI